MVLGSRNRNQMKFTNASRWEQVTLADWQRGKALTNVDLHLILDWKFRAALSELEWASHNARTLCAEFVAFDPDTIRHHGCVNVDSFSRS